MVKDPNLKKLIKSFTQKAYALADLAVQIYNKGVEGDCNKEILNSLEAEPGLKEVYLAAQKIINL